MAEKQDLSDRVCKFCAGKFRKIVDGYNFVNVGIAQPNPALSGGKKSTAEDVNETRTSYIYFDSTPDRRQLVQSYHKIIYTFSEMRH